MNFHQCEGGKGIRERERKAERKKKALIIGRLLCSKILYGYKVPSVHSAVSESFYEVTKTHLYSEWP